MRRSSVLAVPLLVGGLAVLLAGCGNARDASPSDSAMPDITSASATPNEVAGADWSAPTDVVAAADAAGLSLDSEEHLDVHYHAHLTVVVDGQQVPVPAGLGIDAATNRLAHLHTHDSTGILHVEAPAADTYTLGQALTLWGMGFDAQGCLNGICPKGGSEWAVLVDGKPLDGGTAAAMDLPLTSLQQIALVYGDAQQRSEVPPTFDWAAIGYDQ
ncbi:MAG: hypothetical protein WAN48_13655 [Actinomycetes bacterium]